MTTYDDLGSQNTMITRRRLLQGAVATGAAVGAASLLPRLDAIASAAPGAPRRGGRLRVGLVGGGSSETLDPNTGTNEIDIARAHQLFERLVDFHPDGSLYNQLAADFSHNANGTVWKIKVRPGVLFHDGSTLTADDVVYSLQYILNPANKTQGAADIAFMKPQGVRRLDASTVQITLDQPFALLPAALSSRAVYIFKNGTKSFAHPIGTGAWMFKSFTRGERSLFTRFDQYRLHNGPYLDELEIIAINDATTRLNSLMSGQIDALGYLDPKLVSTVKANSALKLMQANSGGYTCQLMQVDKAPFTDNRVRQAVRYMVDREAIVKTALLGYGAVGNDLACPFDPDYAREIPQRPYDPDKARHLLKQAGKSGLTISLYTGDVAPGMLDSSVLIAQQAKKAGVTVLIDKAPTDQYWTNKYLKAPFECTNWGPRPLFSQIAQAFTTKAPYNETDWHRADFDRIVTAAQQTIDATKRHELYVQAQRMLWDQGGYLIWGFLQYLDATSAKVHGLVPSSVRPLGWYTFTDTYLA